MTAKTTQTKNSSKSTNAKLSTSNGVKATLKQYRQSPRKVRLVADFIKGKPVNQALTELRFTTKRAALAIEKLIRSAVANAREKGKEADNLYISHIAVDEGQTLKRFQPVSRGRAHRINKRASHITVELSEKADDLKAKS